MWFEILLVFILFKFKKRPNVSGIRGMYGWMDGLKNMLQYAKENVVCWFYSCEEDNNPELIYTTRVEKLIGSVASCK